MTSRIFHLTALSAAVALSTMTFACSGGNPDGIVGGTGGTGDDPFNPSPGSGGIVINPPTGGTNDDRDLTVRDQVCDDTGTCTCLTLALLGSLDSAADDADTTPFVDWLNNNSGGSAVVDMITNKPLVNRAFLDQYDILLVANVNGWSFSPEEIAAVQSWSDETGGGIVTLTGFVSTATEPADTSQLISWAGLSYNGPPWTAENGQELPVYFGNDSTTNRKECLATTATSQPITTTPIEFTPQTGTMTSLTENLRYVGAFIGFGVNAPADATVVATDPKTGQNMAVAYEVNAKGRILAFGDEWVIFKNQWEAQGMPHNQTKDENNVCYSAETVDEEGNVVPEFFHNVETLYQTKQFWYNAINWVAPPNTCFTIQDDQVVIVK